jgi:hypothetical protein
MKLVKISNGGKAHVYNLTVENKHSYVLAN